MKRKDEINEEKDTNDKGSTGDESEDGQSSISHNVQDSDASFENAVIEEEDWIEHIKKSTDEAMEKMENAKIRSMMEQDSQKNEMETGAENSNITE